MARMIVVDRDGKEHEIEAKTGLKIMEVLRPTMGHSDLRRPLLRHVPHLRR